MSEPVKIVEVVAGVLLRPNGEFFLSSRPPGKVYEGYWEFPGGKIEPGESPQVALCREIIEELHCEVVVGEEVATTTHEYDFGVVTLTTFYCQLRSGDPQLTEHAELRWVAPSQLAGLEWAPADIPAIDRISRDLAS